MTRREQFLAQTNAVISWQRLLDRIEPRYPDTGKGRQPARLEKMLRIYLMQQWFDMSDPAAEGCDLRQRVDPAVCWGEAGGRPGTRRINDSGHVAGSRGSGGA